MTEMSPGQVHVDPWPSEVPLLLLSALVAAGLWLFLALSIIGIIYALAIGLLFFVGHLMLIAHIRGSGVRIGPDQFPELNEMVERLSRRIGLRHAPEAYLMQGGGTLNAFATRFLSANIVVLYSDLMVACGPNRAACEMIVGHELAHVKRGHLRWMWLLMPAYLVPFLGTALSRAREFTCDRYGRALAGESEGALLGLTILAAGPAYATRVNRAALVAQQSGLNTGFMRLGEWLSTHPPLAVRLAMLDPALGAPGAERLRGTLRACAILGALLMPFFVAGVVAALLVPSWLREAAAQAQAQAAGAFDETSEEAYEMPPPELAQAQVREDFDRLIVFLGDEVSAGRALPIDGRDLYKRWRQVRRYESAPFDPYDGQRYGYDGDRTAFVLWSSGPDGRPETDDDIHFDSRTGAMTVGRRPSLRSAAPAVTPASRSEAPPAAP